MASGALPASSPLSDLGDKLCQTVVDEHETVKLAFTMLEDEAFKAALQSCVLQHPGLCRTQDARVVEDALSAVKCMDAIVLKVAESAAPPIEPAAQVSVDDERECCGLPPLVEEDPKMESAMKGS